MEFEEKIKKASIKELCELLREVQKSKEIHSTAILEGCKYLSGREVMDIIFGSIKPEEFSYFKELYLKLKQKEW